MMEGYRITTRGYIVLVLLLALLTYGLFSLGTLMSKDLKTVVDNGLNGIDTTASDSGESPSTTTETEIEGTIENPIDSTSGDTTVGKTDNCNVDTLAKDGTETTSPEDLIKTATVIYFKPDSYEVDVKAKNELQPFIKIALENLEIPIVIEGHAGLTSIVPDNDEKLALKRAQAIRDYLVSKNITSDRINIMSLLGTTDEMKKQQEIWKTMRAEIYFQGYSQEK